MYAAYSHVDCMLDHAVIALYAYKMSLEVVVNLYIIKSLVVFSVDLSDLVELLVESPSDKRCHVEVECWDGLTSVHLVLDCLQ